VPDCSDSRADLRPSRLEGRARRSARFLSLAAAAACLAAAMQPAGVTWVQWAAFAAALTAFAASAWRRPPATERRLEIDAAGRIGVGSADTPSVAASLLYRDRAYICLEHDRRRFPVWRDQLPARQWRRLQVACRWPHRPAQSGTDSAVVRTK